MLANGPAKKVTIYLNEDTVSDNGYLSEAIVSLLLKAGVRSHRYPPRIRLRVTP
jgi:hypothetical protein